MRSYVFPFGALTYFVRKKSFKTNQKRTQVLSDGMNVANSNLMLFDAHLTADLWFDWR